jgi:hypothetical protein
LDKLQTEEDALRCLQADTAAELNPLFVTAFGKAFKRDS